MFWSTHRGATFFQSKFSKFGCFQWSFVVENLFVWKSQICNHTKIYILFKFLVLCYFVTDSVIGAFTKINVCVSVIFFVVTTVPMWSNNKSFIISDLHQLWQPRRALEKPEETSTYYRKERGFLKSAERQYSGEVFKMEKRQHNCFIDPFKKMNFL